MTKFKTNSIIYTLSLILLVGVLAFSLVFDFSSRSMQNAYADYETDYLNNPTALVNFNQLYDPTTTRSSYSGIVYSNSNGLISMVGTNSNTYHNTSNPISEQVISVVANHIYYVRFKFINISNMPNNVGLRLSGTSTMLYNHVSPVAFDVGFYIPNSDTNVQVVAGVVAQTYYNCSFYVSLIDVSQMFGVGNEPTLNQCNDLFVADYYPYNVGSVISFSGYSEYNKGVTDTINSFSGFSVNLAAVSSAFIDSSINNSNAFVTKFYEPSSTDYSYYLQARGYLSIPFNDTAVAGNVISFKYYDPGQGGSGNYLWCGVYYESAFYPIMFIGDYTEQTISFATPVNTQYLMFADSSTRDVFTFSDSAYWLGDFIVDNAKFDIDALLDSARLSAYREKDEFYSAYYSYGDGYTKIYNEGYSSGYNMGLSNNANDFATQFYTFPQFLGALFDVPVRVITSLLDFDIFGFNLKNLIFSLITLAIVFSIIRLILMKTGDK